MNILAQYWDRFQSSLFPRLETVFEEPLTEKLQQFVRVLDIVRIEQFIASPHLQWMGRKALDRRAMARDESLERAIHGSRVEIFRVRRERSSI